MAIKEGMFNDYAKEMEAPKLKEILQKKAGYSHNRVFDEPEYLKKSKDTQMENDKNGTRNLTQTEHKRNTEPNTNGTQR